MNGEAALSTVLVHVLGGIMTLMPLGHRPVPVIPPNPKPHFQVEMQAPVLAIVAESGPYGGGSGLGPSLTHDPGCPSSPPVDVEAVPDFPLIGDGRPFQGIPKAGWSPVFCARIGRNGRILELRTAESYGRNSTADRATARELSRLHFLPACRRGQPVEAWHRILVYLPDTALPFATDRPVSSPPPPVPTEAPIVPTD